VVLFSIFAGSELKKGASVHSPSLRENCAGILRFEKRNSSDKIHIARIVEQQGGFL